MIFNYDYWSNPIPPSLILTKPNGDRIKTIPCTVKKSSFQFNATQKISFETYLYINNELNSVYDRIVEGQYIEIEDVGRYIITNVDTLSEGFKFERKAVDAISAEIELGQKYLELFKINVGTVESIDGVCLYDLQNPDKSLLNLVLEKCPNWSIGHIDEALKTVQRCFEIDRQDIYSFLTTNVSKAFQCVFLFDTVHYKINVYSESNVGEDTDIFVSYNNLLKQTNITSSIDDIKTCLTVTGADDLSLREVNMGYDRIYNIDYFHDLQYMSQGLYDAYTAWKKIWNNNIEPYTSLLSQYQSYYKDINYLQSQKMPTVPDSTNWKEYGLNPLKEKLAADEQKMAVMMKAGQGNPSHKDYKSMYLPCFNEISNIKSQISIVEKEIAALKSSQGKIGKQMDSIINTIDMRNNFTSEQLEELTKFIYEDELSSSNFVVTDVMTDSERMDMLNEMLKFGNEEMNKVSQPQLNFSADILDLFAIQEFKSWHENFNPGNYIHIILRDDYMVKARLLTIEIDHYEKKITVTFGNLNKVRGKNIYTDTTKALDIAKSVSTTVSMNTNYWNRANQEATEISKIIADGLLSAGKYLTNGDNSELVIDSRGIFINTVSGEYAGKDSIFIGGGRILFTDDNWKTVSMSVGRANVTIKGNTESRFGTFADFLIAGYVAGSIIEGNEILAGTIIGTNINNGNGTFSVDEKGYLISSAGNIAGWEITKNAIFNNIPFTNKKDSKSTGMGTYGGNWAFWAGNGKFSVDQDGNLIAETGKIGGADIGATYLQASNGNWRLDSNGSGTFKNVFISGVNSGSSFGTIGWNGSNNWGTFAGTSYFGSSVSTPFSGTCINHIQSISADYIYANYLSAIKADIDKLEVEDATIKNLIAEKASIEQLETANAQIENLKSSSISVNRLTVDGKRANWRWLNVVTSVGTQRTDVQGTDGSTIRVVSDINTTAVDLYVIVE